MTKATSVPFATSGCAHVAKPPPFHSSLAFPCLGANLWGCLEGFVFPLKAFSRLLSFHSADFFPFCPCSPEDGIN